VRNEAISSSGNEYIFPVSFAVNLGDCFAG